MALHVNVEGYEEFKKAAEEHGDKTIFALFTGSAGPNGQSWCPDCVTADPVIERNLKHIPADCVFIRCAVGDRAFWKDQSNVFRKDPKLRLTSVPTLLKYGEDTAKAVERILQEPAHGATSSGKNISPAKRHKRDHTV